MKTQALTIGIILLALLLNIDGKRVEVTIETDSLQKTDARFTDLLKEIQSTFQSRPHNTANNEEFDRYFRNILFGLNLTIYDLGTKIDIYTDFTVYNKIRLELEREMFKKLQVAGRLLNYKNLLPKCRRFFSNQQIQLRASFSLSNLRKLEILHDPSPDCENVEIEKIFVPPTATPKPRNPDKEIYDILQKYKKRPWGKQKYMEFDKQIWNLFMASNKNSKYQKIKAVDVFLAYDDDRAKLDKNLAIRIDNFKQIIATEPHSECRTDLIRLNRKLSRAMFSTIEDKHTILVATNYVQSCLSNHRFVWFDSYKKTDNRDL
ncbi:uncharacterized protein [Drosophila takahashii]|uniref:uncharacterized protein n=1 Tax=Drosophila takahashii TaxID=29030 RepID=UPI003898F180